MKWFTSDMHFGEPRLQIMERPFSSVEENDATIIRNFNEVVGPQDTVYFIGDVASKLAPERIGAVTMLNCSRKILLRGNHDVPHTTQELLELFDEVYEEGVRVRTRIDPIGELVMCHYPTRGLPDAFNLVGHVHSAWRVQLNALNVGVDVNHFFPLSEEDIVRAYTAITSYYDEDVWSAYQPSNAEFVGVRGKPGSYFTGSR